MRQFLLSSIFLSLSLWSHSQADSMLKLDDNWYRYTAISPDGKSIAFTYKGDIYIVDSKGGVAKRLTTHTAHDYHPVWSKNSKKITFASDRYGNMDVFVVGIEGGEPLRLTYHSNDEIPNSFSANDELVIFEGSRMDLAEHRQFPTGYLTEVYTVPAYGGRVDQLWTITAQEVVVNSDGTKYLYHDRTGGENDWRKHHLSSVTRDIWMFDAAKNEHRKVSSFAGEDRNPVFAEGNNEFYFLSEASGSFNIHRKGFDEAGEGMQLTNFKDHPVRFLSKSDGGMLCFTYHGSVYTMTDESKMNSVNIIVQEESGENAYSFIPISGNIGEMAVSPDGKEVALVIRGEIYASSADGSMTKQITHTIEEEKNISYSPDGKKIFYCSERIGRWGIYATSMVDEQELHFYASTLLKEEGIRVNERHNEQARLSPDGKTLAFTEDKTTLQLLNIEAKTIRTVANSDQLIYMNDNGQEFAWSPDSKWLAVSIAPTLANSEIYLFDAVGDRKAINLTQNGHIDYNPTWADNGNMLVWKSTREGMRDYANSGSRQADVYATFMNRESLEKYRLSKEEFELWKEKHEEKEEDSDEEVKKKKKGDEEKEGQEEVKDVVIEFEGLQERVERLTIHSSSLGDATISSDGTQLYYITRFEDKANIWSTDLRTKETKQAIALNANWASFQWDPKGKHLFVLADGRPSKVEEKEGKLKTVEVQGNLKIVHDQERKEMFEHVWQRNQVMFYDRNFHGIDWSFYGAAYRSKLANIGNDFEFAELLSEMLGELNVSHCGARYRRPNSGDRTASLGIFRDYSYHGDGIKITEIIKNGPFDRSSLVIEPGMIITKINGQVISTRIDDAMLLNHLFGEYIALEIYNPATKESKTVSIHTIDLGTEMGLLYDRWVKKNAEEVEKLSEGKLGYVHVPGMGDGPYRSLYGDIMGKYFESEGIVVDTRFNRGGDLVSDLNMFLSGEEFITYENDQRKIGMEPTFRWTKKNIVIANEANYSDGSCFACGYQQQKVGKLVGMPTPGTCSFASWEGLINGTVMWGSIALSAKDKNHEWMENNQTEPDIKVKNDPNKISKGEDEQLERAVMELLK